MTVATRALTVKYNLWKKYRVKKGRITEEILRQAIYDTGLSKKSRGLRAVISYLRDYRHLGKNGDYYYVIYVKKDEANPRGVLFKAENERIRDLLPDRVHPIYDFHFDSESKLYSSLMKMMIDDLEPIKHSLKESGSYTVEFRMI